MPLPSHYDHATWRSAWHDRLEPALVNALRRYVVQYGPTAEAIGLACSELGKLKSGSEPDYNVPHIGLVYAFTYLPHRASSVAGALSYLDLPQPDSILDIGSGCDAISLGLRLAYPEGHPNVTCVEPAGPMLDFGKILSLNLTRTHLPLTTAELRTLEDSIEGEPFDLVTYSACFPSWPDPAELRQLAALTKGALRDGGAALIIEPRYKAGALRRWCDAFNAEGFTVERFDSDKLDAERHPVSLDALEAAVGILTKDIARDQITFDGSELIFKHFDSRSLWWIETWRRGRTRPADVYAIARKG